MPYLQNTVYLNYTIIKSPFNCAIELKPLVDIRPQDTHPGKGDKKYYITDHNSRYEISTDNRLPSLRFCTHTPSELVPTKKTFLKISYHEELERGYEGVGELWTPGYFRANLKEGDSFTLAASCESWGNLCLSNFEYAYRSELKRREHLISSAAPQLHKGLGSDLVLAADQFIITSSAKNKNSSKSIIAGYHWFTDWGRDTMISLEGLTLITGRHREAKNILNTFAAHIKNGLIPNLFPEGSQDGLYHTADATLWFFHALERYLRYTNDKLTLQELLPVLENIMKKHIDGTDFNIGMDSSDKLLVQGEEGYQLTWMDAKVDGWVVTPRRGKAVEINALWYNTLRLCEQWINDIRGKSAAHLYSSLADEVKNSFNKKFWFEKGKYLYDTIDGVEPEDSSCRPNQIFSLSLDYPVLDEKNWKPVLFTVKNKLLTPFGLRSLTPGHPDYKKNYCGNLFSRDSAYHQGTVWAWLIGPFVDAWVRVFPQDSDSIKMFLKEFYNHINEGCIGSINEIFDAQEPFTARGCIAQAWSVAEVARCLLTLTRIS